MRVQNTSDISYVNACQDGMARPLTPPGGAIHSFCFGWCLNVTPLSAASGISRCRRQPVRCTLLRISPKCQLHESCLLTGDDMQAGQGAALTTNPTPHTGKYVWIWRRTPEGWRMATAIWNSDIAPR